MDNSNPTLRKAYKILSKIAKKVGRDDVYFSAQIGIDSARGKDETTFAAYMAPVREGLAPVTFASHDKKDFIDKLQKFLDEKVNEDEVAIAYHEAQIDANRRSTQHHEYEIEKIKNPDSQEENTNEEE